MEASRIKRCDNCGRKTEKFWRRYRGMSFCGACYNREFKPCACHSCGKVMRAHKNEPKPKCSLCLRLSPCIRCGKIAKRLGAITEYGNVCPSCRHYFQEPKACANCGKLTTRLSKSKPLGFEEPVCDKCYSSYRATCSSCGRHRKLTQADDGKRYCKPCSVKGAHNCKQCSQIMPAGYGSVCQKCYYENLFNKRVVTCLAGLNNQFYSDLFLEFSVWLKNDVGTHKAAITLNRNFPFFYFLNLHFPNKVPSYNELIVHHGEINTRINSFPIRFLCETQRMRITHKEKDAAANRRTVEKMLASKTGIPALDKLIFDYHQHLMKKLANNKTTLRSIRLAMSPAIAFVEEIAASGKMEVEQIALNQYLAKKTGQYSAITGFVSFCKNREFMVEMPNKSNLSKVNNRAEIERLLIQHIKKDDDLIENTKYRVVALAYFHFISLQQSQAIVKQGRAFEGKKNVSVKLRDLIYIIPKYS